MCGRFVVSTKNAFGLKYETSYNVTPSQLVPVKTKNDAKLMRWSYSPSWKKDMNLIEYKFVPNWYFDGTTTCRVYFSLIFSCRS